MTASAPTARKERAEEFAGFVGADPVDNQAFVVEAGVREQVVAAADRSGLRIARAEDHQTDPSVHQRARTHRARFERDHERAVVEPPRSERDRRVAQSEDLSVGGGVVSEFSFVVSTRDDLAGIDAGDDRADGHIAVRLSRARFVECKLHQPVDRLALHAVEPTYLPPRVGKSFRSRSPAASGGERLRSSRCSRSDDGTLGWSPVDQRLDRIVGPMTRRRLVVMADYSAFPVWDRTESRVAGLSGDVVITAVSDSDFKLTVSAEEANELLSGAMVGGEQLPISRRLRTQLWGWAAIYECQNSESDRWTPECPMDDWLDWGRSLAVVLQDELGPGYEVLFHDERTGEEKPV